MRRLGQEETLKTRSYLDSGLIGGTMRECVSRAIPLIRGMRTTAAVHRKAHPTGKTDYVTEADIAAQQEYARVLQTVFPTFGIVAEEEGLAVPCTNEEYDIWFTIDPLDGTKAYVRGQSHGIGTMISLVCDGEIIAAYVGDVMTGEIYGYAPDTHGVQRIDDAYFETLSIDPDRPLLKQYVVLRDHPMQAHSAFVRAMAGFTPGEPMRFRDVNIESGSIGIHMARLWKGEVGAMVLKAGRHTPWDLAPVLGISRKMGFRFIPLLSADEPGGWGFGQDEFAPSKAEQYTPTETLIVHESRLDEIAAWQRPT